MLIAIHNVLVAMCNNTPKVPLPTVDKPQAENAMNILRHAEPRFGIPSQSIRP